MRGGWIGGGVLALGLAGCGASGGLEGLGGASPNARSIIVEADFHTLRTPPRPEGAFDLLTLSTLPDAVTGGDVLMAVRGLATADRLSVAVDGVDQTAAFSRREGGEWRGLVSGLRLGANTVTATAEGPAGRRQASLTVVNHPITGPVISGPHQQPFRCRTEEVGLGAPVDEFCSAPTQFTWYYRSLLTQSFRVLEAPFSPYPADVMTTRTRDGRAVPFVVRVEAATINRSITRIAVLDDPAARGRDAPFTPNWNRRVYHAFGESCGVGFDQGRNDDSFVLGNLDLTTLSADRLLINLTGITDRLAKGDAIVHSTLTAYGTHCNPLISIETAMMIKEHISETYGDLVEAVVGTNGSGAALQQYNAANNAPGLISAAMPTATFTDIPSTAMTVADCGLLQAYYARTELDWSDRQKAAVNGHNLLSGNTLNAICQSWVDTFLDRLDPTTGCSVPAEQRFHPENNPNGVRCTVQEANVNLLGRDPVTGLARRPLDNTGVQYGLQALRDGVISAEQFLDLNRRIGGFDEEARIVPERMRMSDELAERLFTIGFVVGRGALAETPVLDLAPYLDLIPVANIHEAVRPFQVRARLRQYQGTDRTQVIWRGVVTQADAYTDMERWLDAVLANRPDWGGDHAAAVAASRPPLFGDRCAFGTVGGRLDLPNALLAPLGIAQLPLLPGLPADIDVSVPLRVDVPEDFDSGLGVCALALPVTSTPRGVAGMPATDDVLACQLKPIDPADYAGRLSAAQLAELATIFPEGVCDYSKPSRGFTEKSLIWPSVGSGPVAQEPFELRWRVARALP